MKKLADAVEEPTEKSTAAFEKLGISMEQAKNMSQEDLFGATITALQKMESGTERTALANDLLGKSAMDLGALLNTSAEDTEAMMQQVHDLGGVMSDDAVKASAAYQDSLQNVKTAISGVGRNIGTKIKTAGVKSRNIPMTSKKTFMMSRITYLLFDTPIIIRDIALGMPVRAMT